MWFILLIIIFLIGYATMGFLGATACMLISLALTIIFGHKSK